MADTSTRTVDRALALLTEVCSGDPLSLSEVSERVGLSPSTSLRLLNTLAGAGFVHRDEGGLFSPGGQLVRLGALALSNDSLVTLAEPTMRRVMTRTGESCYLSIRHTTDEALYVAIVEGTHSVRHTSWVGHTIPLATSAAGACLAGRVGPHGYVVVGQGVESDVTSIAVPVRAGDKIVAAMSTVVPTYRLKPEDVDPIGTLLVAEAAGIFPASGHTSAVDPQSDGQ